MGKEGRRSQQEFLSTCYLAFKEKRLRLEMQCTRGLKRKEVPFIPHYFTLFIMLSLYIYSSDIKDQEFLPNVETNIRDQLCVISSARGNH